MEIELKNKLFFMLVFLSTISSYLSQDLRIKEKKIKGRIEIHLIQIDSLYKMKGIFLNTRSKKINIDPFRSYSAEKRDSLDHFLLDSTTSIFNNSLLSYNYTGINQECRFCNKLVSKEVYFSQDNSLCVTFNFQGILTKKGKEYCYLSTKKVSKLRCKQINKLRYKKYNKNTFIIFNAPIEIITSSEAEK